MLQDIQLHSWLLLTGCHEQLSCLHCDNQICFCTLQIFPRGRQKSALIENHCFRGSGKSRIVKPVKMVDQKVAFYPKIMQVGPALPELSPSLHTPDCFPVMLGAVQTYVEEPNNTILMPHGLQSLESHSLFTLPFYTAHMRLHMITLQV